MDDEEAGNLAKTKRLDGKKCTDLIVLNLPWRVEEPALKSYFSRFGDVVMAQVSCSASLKDAIFVLIWKFVFKYRLKVIIVLCPF